MSELNLLSNFDLVSDKISSTESQPHNKFLLSYSTCQTIRANYVQTVLRYTLLQRKYLDDTYLNRYTKLKYVNMYTKFCIPKARKRIAQ